MEDPNAAAKAAEEAAAKAAAEAAEKETAEKAAAEAARKQAAAKTSVEKTTTQPAPRRGKKGKAGADPDGRVCVVLRTSRILNPATGRSIPRGRLVDAPARRAETMLEAGQARRASPGEVKAVTRIIRLD